MLKAVNCKRGQWCTVAVYEGILNQAKKAKKAAINPKKLNWVSDIYHSLYNGKKAQNNTVRQLNIFFSFFKMEKSWYCILVSVRCSAVL